MASTTLYIVFIYVSRRVRALSGRDRLGLCSRLHGQASSRGHSRAVCAYTYPRNKTCVANAASLRISANNITSMGTM